MKKITLLSFLLFSLSFIAQNNGKTNSKWLFKLGANIVDNSGDLDPFNGLELNKMGFSNNIAAGIDYELTNHWSIGLMASLNKFKASRAELDGVFITEDMNYFATDVNLKYFFWSAEKNKRFNIYLSGGAGMFKIVDNTASLNFGGGFIFWLNDSFGINIESVAKWTFEDDVKFDSNHFQHFAGITYRHNSNKDSDGDGINDSEDACPNNFGLKEFNGCPDSDNDGIIDSEDNCPEQAGLKKDNGCPDSDNDGVIDSLDTCKNTFGPIDNNGCPYKDSDSDGVFDKDDACPNTKGLKTNNGCPKVEEKEISENNTKENIKKANEVIGSYSKSIYFNTGKHSFKYSTMSVLKEIVLVLNNYPDSNIIIEGHTDSVGNYDSNKELSKSRANAVKNYLIENNISKENITVVGYGETQPIASNNTKQGRALNRRVVIKIK